MGQKVQSLADRSFIPDKNFQLYFFDFAYLSSGFSRKKRKPTMAKTFSLITLSFCLFACGPLPMPSNPSPPAEETVTEPEEPSPTPGNPNTEFLAAVNALRQNGCTCGDGQRMPAVPSLKWNSKLESAARRHSNDMAKNSHFDHRGADRSTMDQRVSEAGYRWATVAENIALATPTIPAVVEQWRQSTHGHCQNMMSKEHTELGAAWQEGPEGRYWTLVLASPL